jgi:hypothetical protein
LVLIALFALPSPLTGEPLCIFCLQVAPTLKGVGADGSPGVRSEIVCPGAPGLPPIASFERLRAYMRTHNTQNMPPINPMKPANTIG